MEESNGALCQMLFLSIDPRASFSHLDDAEIRAVWLIGAARLLESSDPCEH